MCSNETYSAYIRTICLLSWLKHLMVCCYTVCTFVHSTHKHGAKHHRVNYAESAHCFSEEEPFVQISKLNCTTTNIKLSLLICVNCNVSYFTPRDTTLSLIGLWCWWWCEWWPCGLVFPYATNRRQDTIVEPIFVFGMLACFIGKQ